MKLNKLALAFALTATAALAGNIGNSHKAQAEESEYTYVEGNWQYYSQSDTNVSRDFKRTPYIAGMTSTAPSTYYAQAEGKTGDDLKLALASIISGPTLSYDWSRFDVVDEDPYNSNNVFMIYARNSYAKSAHVSGNTPYTWNREHTYPQSKLVDDAKKDSHIVFADDWKTNGIRSNDPYGVVAHTTSNLVVDSAGTNTANYSSGTTFEPTDAAKGEVARSTLYAYTLYGQSILGNISSVDLLLEWHLRYPVTTWEMRRNNLNYGVQKNRNPFTDHPEYACAMLGNTDSSTQSVCANTTPLPMQGEDTEVTNVMNLITAIGTVGYDSEAAIIAAETAYAALTPSQKTDVSNYQTLLSARAAFDSLPPVDNDVIAVISLIDAIGIVNLDSETAIINAETAYNALSSAQQLNVLNYQTLVDALALFDELNASRDIINNVISLIDAIGNVTLDSETAIVAAETAYYQLTTAQKNMVSNYGTLVTARQTYDDLLTPDDSSAYTFNFYNADKLSATSGTGLTQSYFISKEINSNGNVVTGLTITNTVQYDKNGGLTLGAGSKNGGINITFNAKISRVEIIGTVYDAGVTFDITNATSVGSLASKGTALESIQTPVTYTLSAPANTINIATSSKRATIYKISFYAEVSPLERLTTAIKNADTCTDYPNTPSYLSQYESLSAAEKSTFGAETDATGVNLYDKMMYMKTLYERSTSGNNGSITNTSLSEHLPLLLLSGIIITTLIAAIVFVEKKKYTK